MFLANSQAALMLLDQGPHFENYCSRQSGGIRLFLSWSWKPLNWCLDRISRPKLWVQNKIKEA